MAYRFVVHERLGRMLDFLERLHRPMAVTAMAITVIALVWGTALAAQGHWGGWHGALRHLAFAAVLLIGIGIREKQHRRHLEWISRSRDSQAPNQAAQVGLSGDS